MSVRTSQCPVCRQPVPGLTAPALRPFCSARCRTIDLGAWLQADYRIPTDESLTEVEVMAVAAAAERPDGER